MRLQIARLAVMIALGATAYAGGTSYETTIEAFETTGTDQYRLLVKPTAFADKRESIVIHLRYRPQALGRTPPPMISLQAYRECVARLKEHYQKREQFRLGEMGTGLVPIPGKPGEYQSNALALLKEYQGNQVCYSFGNPG